MFTTLPNEMTKKWPLFTPRAGISTMYICLVEFHSPALPPTMYVQKASDSTIQLDSSVVQAPSWQGVCRYVPL